MINVALTGLAGDVAPRHLQAIRSTGNRLVAALDPHDSVGVVDSYFPEAAFFTEFERFDRHLERLRRGPDVERVDLVSVCAPTHLHDAHVRLALRVGADALCETPLALNPWNLDHLEELEAEHGRRVWTVLQLRLHPTLVALKQSLDAAPSVRHTVQLTNVKCAGRWYRYSWKGDPARSGGIATSVGIHYFDLLIWLFGGVRHYEVHVSEPERAGGFLALERADVAWFLSLDPDDLPDRTCRSPYRSITVDGEEIEFADGFPDLHARVYGETLAGRGVGIAEVRPSIELAHRIRTSPTVSPRGGIHPTVAQWASVGRPDLYLARRGG